jgi:hypothetical protein
MRQLDIDQIRTAGLINTNILGTWADACIILLEQREHIPGVNMEVSGYLKEACQLTWGSVTNRLGYEDNQNLAEWGAYGMALLLVYSMTDYTFISRSIKGTGIDIWLGKSTTDDEFNFFASDEPVARLECKGTRNKNSVGKHLKQGLSQSSKSDTTGLPLLVISVDFETPLTTTAYRS